MPFTVGYTLKQPNDINFGQSRASMRKSLNSYFLKKRYLNNWYLTRNISQIPESSICNVFQDAKQLHSQREKKP
jgi:hypothetical protein